MKYSNNIKNIKKYIFFNQIATFINSLSTEKIETLKRKFSYKILRYRVTFLCPKLCTNDHHDEVRWNEFFSKRQTFHQQALY